MRRAVRTHPYGRVVRPVQGYLLGMWSSSVADQAPSGFFDCRDEWQSLDDIEED